jgi:hypothetical protein
MDQMHNRGYPTQLQFGLAVARLNALSNRTDEGQLTTVAASCLHSLGKLDDVLATITRPGTIKTGNLVHRDGDQDYVRKPVVGLSYSLDQFPARRGNLELWVEVAEGYEEDFTVGLIRQKLLRVDNFSDTCEAAQGLDASVDQRDAMKIVESVSVVFRHIEGLVAKSFGIIMDDDFTITVDQATGTLCKFEVGPGQDDQPAMKV